MDKTYFRDNTATRGLTGAEIDRLITVLEERTFAPGEKLCTTGATTRGLYLVREGRIAISGRGANNTEQPITTLEAPTVIGELELISGQAAFATGTAETQAVAYLLSHEAFEKLVNAGDPIASKLTRNVSRVVIQRLVESNARLVSLMYK